MNQRRGGRMGSWKDGYTDEQMDGWMMSGWMDGWMYIIVTDSC